MRDPVFPNTAKGLRCISASEFLVLVLGVLNLYYNKLSFLAVFHKMTVVAVIVLLISSLLFCIGIWLVSLDGFQNKAVILIELVRIALYLAGIITIMTECSDSVTEMIQICAELCRLFDLGILLSSITYAAYSLADRIVARLTGYYSIGLFAIIYGVLALIRVVTILIRDPDVLQGMELAFNLLHIFPNLIMLIVLYLAMRMLWAGKGVFPAPGTLKRYLR